jgi:hypothetical protein
MKALETSDRNALLGVRSPEEREKVARRAADTLAARRGRSREELEAENDRLKGLLRRTADVLDEVLKELRP